MSKQCALLLWVSLIFLSQGLIVYGQAPVNDSCDQAIVISDGTTSGTTLGATSDGESSCDNLTGMPDVWYEYTAVCSGQVTFDTCGSGFDTLISLHGMAAKFFDSGGFENETPGMVPSNALSGTWHCITNDGVNEQVFGPDSGGPGAFNGSQYLYVGHDGVSGLRGGAGGTVPGVASGTIRASFALYLPMIRTGNGTHVQMNFGNGSTGLEFGSHVNWLGTAHPDDVDELVSGNPGAPADHAVLVAYTSAWDYVTTSAGSTNMSIPYDQWNQIVIDLNLDANTYTVTVNEQTSDTQPISQDLAVNAFGIGTNTDTADGIANSIYFDDLVITEMGSGDCSDGISTELACNDNCHGSACEGQDSCVTIPMISGDRVLVRVANAQGAGGDFDLNVSCSTSVPLNDNCENALVISPDDGEILATTFGATNDGSSTCGPSETSPDIWYSYTAPEDGTLYVNMVGKSGFVSTVVSAHMGCPGSADNTVACVSGAGQSGLAIPVSGGIKYLLRASGADNSQGDFSFGVNFVPPPPLQEELKQMLTIEWHAGERLPREFQDSDGGIIHNKLVSACGFTTTSVFFDDVFALDLGNRQAGWSTIANYPVAPLQELFSVVIDEEIYYWGGFSYSSPYAYNEGYKLSYNEPADQWSWSPLPSLPWRVCSSGIAVIGSKIYVHGGADYDKQAFYTWTDRYGQNENLGSHMLALDINDMASGWQQLPDCPGTPRWVHVMSNVNDKLYVIGGATGSPYGTAVDNWVFDPTDNSWSRLPDLPVSSGNFPNGCNIVFDDRYIILVGGYQYSQAWNNRVPIDPYGEGHKSDQPSTLYFADVFVFDTLTNTFGRAEDLPLNNNLPMAVVRDNEIFLMGGETGGAYLLDTSDGLVYDSTGEFYAHRPDLFMIGTITEYQDQCGDVKHPYPLGDYTKDCVVDLFDFAWLVQRWLQLKAPLCDVENWSFEEPDILTGTGENYGNHVGWATSCGLGYLDERDWLFTTGFNPPDPNRPQWLTMEGAGCEAYQTLVTLSKPMRDMQ